MHDANAAPRCLDITARGTRPPTCLGLLLQGLFPLQLLAVGGAKALRWQQASCLAATLHEPETGMCMHWQQTCAYCRERPHALSLLPSPTGWCNSSGGQSAQLQPACCSVEKNEKKSKTKHVTDQGAGRWLELWLELCVTVGCAHLRTDRAHLPATADQHCCHRAVAMS